MRDISKKHKNLIKNELCTWDMKNKQIKQTYKLASKFLLQTMGRQRHKIGALQEIRQRRYQ